jgi:hypothetical protein
MEIEEVKVVNDPVGMRPFGVSGLRILAVPPRQ